MPEPALPRREFRNINALTDLTKYRLPAAGWVSILHRVSGALMFLLLPFVIWMLDASVSSEISYRRFTAIFNGGITGVFFKMVVVALVWAYLHHFIAGLRHLWMDMSHHAVEKKPGANSATATLVLSIGLAIILAAKIFGLY